MKCFSLATELGPNKVKTNNLVEVEIEFYWLMFDLKVSGAILDLNSML